MGRIQNLVTHSLYNDTGEKKGSPHILPGREELGKTPREGDLATGMDIPNASIPQP